MNITMFLILLSSFSILSSLVTEGIKNIVSDKVNLSYNLVASQVGYDKIKEFLLVLFANSK